MSWLLSSSISGSLPGRRTEWVNRILTPLQLSVRRPSGDLLTSLEGVLDVVDLHLWSWHPEYALMLETCWEQKGICLFWTHSIQIRFRCWSSLLINSHKVFSDSLGFTRLDLLRPFWDHIDLRISWVLQHIRGAFGETSTAHIPHQLIISRSSLMLKLTVQVDEADAALHKQRYGFGWILRTQSSSNSQRTYGLVSHWVSIISSSLRLPLTIFCHK